MKRSIGGGLWLGVGAAGIFAFCLLAATLYIGG